MRACISNDAFYMLSQGEEPLDEANAAEAEHYRNMFPEGLMCQRLPDPAPAGKMWCDIDGDWDLEESRPPRRRLRLKYVGVDRVRVWLYDILTGERVDYGVSAVDKKNGAVPYGSGSVQYISRFSARQHSST